MYHPAIRIFPSHPVGVHHCLKYGNVLYNAVCMHACVRCTLCTQAPAIDGGTATVLFVLASHLFSRFDGSPSVVGFGVYGSFRALVCMTLFVGTRCPRLFYACAWVIYGEQTWSPDLRTQESDFDWNSEHTSSFWTMVPRGSCSKVYVCFTTVGRAEM